MYLSSEGIINGYIQNKYGKYAHDNEKIQGVPTISLPIEWKDLPEGTKSLALVMQDYDAVPVCGFSWIHWLVADIEPQQGQLKENASREDKTLIQGKNSLASKQINGLLPANLTDFYSGPQPPDKDHEYEITLYALDTKLNLKTGFRLNELIKAIRQHTMESASLHGIYKF